jgi:hypothetical protein
MISRRLNPSKTALLLNGRLGSNDFAFVGGFRIWRDSRLSK